MPVIKPSNAAADAAAAVSSMSPVKISSQVKLAMNGEHAKTNGSSGGIGTPNNNHASKKSAEEPGSTPTTRSHADDSVDNGTVDSMASSKLRRVQTLPSSSSGVAVETEQTIGIRPSKSDVGQSSTTGGGAAADAQTTTATAAAAEKSGNGRGGKRKTTRQQKHALDRFGFILNLDSRGNVRDIQDDDLKRSKERYVPSFAEASRTERRVKKWDGMMGSWLNVRRRRNKLLLRRCRKGVPEAQRGKVWSLLGDIPTKIQNHSGLYEKLVRLSLVGATTNSTEVSESATTSTAANGDGDASNSTADRHIKHTKSFKNIQDTIERDIHRTFPRHSMFFEDDETTNDAGDENNSGGDQRAATGGGAVGMGLCGSGEITDMIRELELPGSPKRPPSAAASTTNTGDDDEISPEDVLNSEGGQASLRRVLKAYSIFDREIGYCQGMNFIAGMFLTVMPEEEAFWLLVAVMYDEPCHMRGLFGEGMRETHKVLYVAEKLIQQFLPRLYKHLEKENIHVTMFATQWLLTQYTSSFKFDLVTRVWDSFLAEGWKITFRVMLAILQKHQSRLLSMTFEDILAFFRETPDRVDGAQIVDAAVKIPLRTSHVQKYEKEWGLQHQG